MPKSNTECNPDADALNRAMRQYIWALIRRQRIDNVMLRLKLKYALYRLYARKS